ncbi:MAG TPA: flap endonuclease-1 [Casimicrobiaceae bacterium]|nr:flap endonuclease-1 [Casimicrobiaceae bacterium]
MGVLLTPIVVKETVALRDLAGKRLAVDGNGELYQFLALIRQRDGTPLMTSRGHITSHLVGLFYRTTRLIGEHGLKLVFVFDGAPPSLKHEELARRRDVRARYERETAQARAEGDFARAYSKATMTSRLTRDMVDEARQLLQLLGIPVVQARSEGEAQASHLAARGDVWAVASKDYDSLLFGAPRLLRFLTITGKEFLPSKGVSRPLTPELIALGFMLAHYGITREQLIDIAILIGTDFNAGVRGIGPKKALKLVRGHGRIEAMPQAIRDAVAGYETVRAIYLQPEVSDEYAIAFRSPDDEGVVRFLAHEREFSADRVRAALERMRSGPV